MNPFLLTALAAAPLVTPAPTTTAPVAQDVLGFPGASADWVIPPCGEGSNEAGLPLTEVVKRYGQLTGQAVTYTDETHQFLANTQLRVIGGMNVPAARVQATFETLLAAHDFVLIPLMTTEPRMVMVVSLLTGDRNMVRSHAIHVDSGDVEALKDHPAVLVTTVVDLPNTDVRQLSNSLRTMIVDANTQQFLPAGNTNSMVITGFGAEVARTVELLKLVDAASKIERAHGGEDED